MQHREGNPFFSVVIPVWNRRDSIARCLRSVAGQSFRDFEVIVTDDASTDGTPEVIQALGLPGLTLLRHSENRGVCPARQTGTAQARGQWIVSLDSDWELFPDALKFLASLAGEAPDSVGLIGGFLRTDTGEIWPGAKPPQETMDFEHYLEWINVEAPLDYLSCRRREVFRELSWPLDRRFEGQFNLRVARKWKMRIAPEILAKQYTDSVNRLTADRAAGSEDRKRRRAICLAAESEEILAEFGPDLRRKAPCRYWMTLHLASMESFKLGRRWRGLRYGLRALGRRPWAVHLLGMVLAGLLGPRVLFGLRNWSVTHRAFAGMSRLLAKRSHRETRP